MEFHPNYDSDHCPSDAYLKEIATAPAATATERLAILTQVAGEFEPYGSAVMTVVTEKDRAGISFRLATGGWSGNESLIGALRENFILWALAWDMSARGGLHVFFVEQEPAPPEK